MTVEEKLGQLQQLPWAVSTGPGGSETKDVEDAARAGRLGSVLNIFGAKSSNALQRIAVEESRLGVPLLFGLDVIHGLWTTFPIPLAQASSFDPEVTRRDAEVSARESRSNGVHWTFSPMMDVTHEPRWGRIAEGCGEDPYLTTAFAVAKVEGYQGEKGSGLDAKDRIAACAKHFVAYGGAEGGRDYNTVDVSESRLRNHYLPPFKAALDAGVATVMASFNTISGVPAHGNSHTLTDVLSKEWGFDGFVVSDWNGVDELIAHGFAEDGADAARLALNAACRHGDGQHGPGQARQEAAERRQDQQAAPRRGGHADPAPEVRARALREPVRRRGRRHRQAVRGGPQGRPRDRGPLDGAPEERRQGASAQGVHRFDRGRGSVRRLRRPARHVDVPGRGEELPSGKVLAAVKAAAPRAKVTYAKGVDPEGEDTGGIPAAVAAAKDADVTVVVVGEPPAMSGEAAARSDISLPGGQEKLIEAIAGTGKPFVVVLVNGRPLTIGDWLKSAPAVLEAWHPGLEAGNAIADVLFGEVNPGGKLPVSFPRTVGQIPVHYNHESTGRPYSADNKYTSKYLDLPPNPQFAFGHGLSYTSFEIGEPRLSRDRVSARALRKGDTLEVSVSVRNTGDRTGDEVVQLYVHDIAASIAQPVRKLRGFRRVTLKAGRSTTVRFQLGAEDLGFWTNAQDGEFRVEEGAVDLYVGNSSEAEAKKRLTIT